MATVKCEKVDAKAVYYFFKNYNSDVFAINRHHGDDDQLDTLVWDDVVSKVNKIDEDTEAELNVIVNTALKKFYDALDDSAFYDIMIKICEAVDVNELF